MRAIESKMAKKVITERRADPALIASPLWGGFRGERLIGYLNHGSLEGKRITPFFQSSRMGQLIVEEHERSCTRAPANEPTPLTL